MADLGNAPNFKLLPWQERLMHLKEGHRVIVLKPRQYPLRELRRLMERIGGK